MCQFFSFITLHGEKYYFDWEQRKAVDFKDCDSHGEVVKFHNLTDDVINAYEYNPLTKELAVDCQHGEDNKEEVLAWIGVMKKRYKNENLVQSKLSICQELKHEQ